MKTVGINKIEIINGYKYFSLLFETTLNVTDKINVTNNINITVPIGSYKNINNGNIREENQPGTFPESGWGSPVHPGTARKEQQNGRGENRVHFCIGMWFTADPARRPQSSS